jgi:hypothetical protein
MISLYFPRIKSMIPLDAVGVPTLSRAVNRGDLRRKKSRPDAWLARTLLFW